MTSKMHDWIVPIVETELNNAYLLLRATSLPEGREPVEESGCSVGPNGVSVRMGKGNLVQLIHRNGRNDVILSDGFTKARAAFSETSTKGFRRKYKRPFTDRTVGGFLEIGDYVLTFNPKSSPSKRIKLIVKDFNYLGSEGSPISEQLINIEEKDCLREIIGNLNDLCRQIMGSEVTFPMKSPTSASRSSPTCFATQPAVVLQISDPVSGRQSVKEKPRIAPPPGKGISLLAKLCSNTLKDQPIGQDRKFEGMSGSLLQMSEKDINSIRKPNTSLPVTNNEVKRTTSNITANTSMPPGQQLSSQHSHRASHSSADSSSIKNFDRSKVHSSSLASKDNGKEHGQEITNTLNATPSELQGLSIREIVIDQSSHGTTVSFTSHARDVKPFEGLKRIPRSYVSVPESQRNILDRNDSWIKSETHRLSILANVPLDVLEDLRSFTIKQKLQNPAKSGRVADEIDGVDSATKVESDDRSERVEDQSDGSDDNSEDEDDFKKECYQAGSKMPLPNFPSDFLGKVNEEDEQGNNYQPSSEDEQISWTTSPERDANIGFFHQNIGKSQQIHSPLAKVSCSTILDTPRSGTFSPFTSSQALSPIASAQSRTIDPKNPVKPRITRDYDTFPSSCGAEEDLELDIPHAIGDEVEDSDLEFADNPTESQELPSTAINENLVQVEQTPFSNLRLHGQSSFDPRPFQEHTLPPLNIAKYDPDRENESSDPIIPATFDEALAPELPLHLQHKDQNGEEAGKESRVGRALANNGPKPLDDWAEKQVLTEIKSSQQIEIAPSSRNSKLPESTARTDLHLIIEESPPKPSLPTVFPAHSATILLPNEAIPSRIEPVDASRLEQGISNTTKPGQKSHAKHRQRIKAPVFRPSQGNRVPRDISEMARLNRHNFSRQVSAEVGKNIIPDTTLEERVAKLGQLVEDADLPDPLKHSKRLERTTPQALLPEDCLEDPEDVHFDPESSFSPTHWETSPIDHVHHDTNRNTNMSLQIIPLSGDEVRTYSDKSCDVGTKITSFQKFQATYPTYQGSQKLFTQAVCYIDWLITGEKHCPNPTLWDEFIRIFATEYLDYARDVQDKGINKRDALSGVAFFILKSEDPLYSPLFCAGVITSSTIKAAVRSLDSHQVERARELLNGSYSKEGARDTASSKTTRSVLSTTSMTEQHHQSGGDSRTFIEHAELKPELSDNYQPSSGIKQSHISRSFKRPFFETPSQFQTSKRPKLSANHEGSSPRMPEGVRRLTWPQPTTTQTQTPCFKIADSNSEISRLTPSTRSASDYQGIPKRGSTQWQSDNKKFLGSPILGEIENGVSRHLQWPTSQASPATSPQGRSASKSPSMAAHQNDRRQTTSITRTGDLSKVEGWLVDQNSREHQEGWKAFASRYAAKKKQSGEFASTPRSSFCTKFSRHTPRT